jgi:hypothetical protein
MKYQVEFHAARSWPSIAMMAKASRTIKLRRDEGPDARFEMKRMNHQEAYSLDHACTESG